MHVGIKLGARVLGRFENQELVTSGIRATVDLAATPALRHRKPQAMTAAMVVETQLTLQKGVCPLAVNTVQLSRTFTEYSTERARLTSLRSRRIVIALGRTG
jgi:hypothetical protein